MPFAQPLTTEQLSEIISLFDATRFGLVIVDAEGTIIGANKQLGALFEYPAEELLGKSAELFWQGFRRQHQYHLFFMNLAEQQDWQGELICKTRHGNIFPVHLSWHFQPEHKNIALGIFEDMTEQKRWESKILEARDRAERYLDISQAMIVALDRQGTITEINRRGCEIFAYDATEMIGQNWFEIAIPEVLRRSEMALFQAMLSGQEPAHNSIESEVVAADGKIHHILWHHSLVEDEHGKISGTLSSGQDISRRKAAEEEILRLAMTDHLTGLLNRHSFYQRFNDNLKLARRNQLHVACIAIDLDHFKPINDQYGHQAGDKVLIRVAELMRTNFRETDSLGRLGGDEFSVVAVLSGDHSNLEDSLQRLLTAIRQPMEIDDETVSIGASIGVSYYPSDGDNMETLLRHADQALYQAKHGGRNRVESYSPSNSETPQNCSD